MVGLDGLRSAPIGSPAAAVADLPGAQAEGSGGGCQAYVLGAGTGVVRVVTLDGVVVSAAVIGEAQPETYSDLPFRLGMTAEDAAAAVPAGAVPTEGALPGSVSVRLGQRTVEAELFPPVRWVEDVEQAVSGGATTVSLISVSDAAVARGRINC